MCDVITTDMPDVCVSKKPSPAYKYSNEGGCRILGDIMKNYAVSSVPSNSSSIVCLLFSLIVSVRPSEYIQRDQYSLQWWR